MRRVPMRLCILTFGSRGDVQPYVALARALDAAGYPTALLASPSYRAFIESHGVEWRSFDTGDPRALIHSPEARELVRGMANPVRMVRDLIHLIEPLLEKGYTEACQNTADADALLVAPTALPIAHALRDLRKIPFACAFLQPSHATREFGSWILPAPPRWLPFRGPLCRWSYRIGWELLYKVTGRAYEHARQRVLGLPPAGNPFRAMERERWPTLYGFSRAVVPRPADWGRELEITGYWFLDREPGWRPPAALEAFLDAGPKPICVGFGSMPSPDPAALTREVVGALERAGQRGILLSGWGALAGMSLPESVFALEAAPHDWLFPRVSAVVHHGGAGTSAAALRAGVPSLVVPFIADQWFWGERIFRLGAGPRLFSRKRLTADRFAPVLRELATRESYREAAQRIAAEIASEDGLGRAVAALPF
ncbi:MAG TPA: glycosyltransferase [Myxococcota bacterium]|nr:glycosyltransferase [Myxococcota bacterium]